MNAISLIHIFLAIFNSSINEITFRFMISRASGSCKHFLKPFCSSLAPPNHVNRVKKIETQFPDILYVKVSSFGTDENAPNDHQSWSQRSMNILNMESIYNKEYEMNICAFSIHLTVSNQDLKMKHKIDILVFSSSIEGTPAIISKT